MEGRFEILVLIVRYIFFGGYILMGETRMNGSVYKYCKIFSYKFFSFFSYML